MANKKYIDEFYLTNIKKLRKLEGKVHGKHFALVGPNGIGKTAGFQGVRRGIAALPDADKPDIWITKGEDGGEIKVKLVSNGDIYYVQEKITTGSRSRLRLWKETDGRRDELTPAQTRLQEIFGNVMDLTPLIDMSGKDQFNFLKARLGIDSTGYETDRKTLLKQRNEVKGKKSMLLHIMEEQAVSEDDIKAYAEEKKVDDILKKKTDVKPLEIALAEHRRKLMQFQQMKQRTKEIEQEVRELVQESERLRDELKKESFVTKDLDKTVQELDIANKVNREVEQELQTISIHNVKHNQVEYYLEKKKGLADVDKEYKKVSEKIDKLDKDFFNNLAALPFEDVYKGLQLVYVPEDKEGGTSEQVGLYLDELPFHRAQLSYGTMIKCLVKLACYLNPEGLNFIYISDWDLLDKANQDELLEFAEKEENVQFGIEKVDNSSEIAIEFIELKDPEKKTVKKSKGK